MGRVVSDNLKSVTLVVPKQQLQNHIVSAEAVEMHYTTIRMTDLHFDQES